MSNNFQGIHNEIWNLYIMCVFHNSLLAFHKMCDRLLDNNLSIEAKWQKGATQGAVSYHIGIITKICLI